MKIQHMAFMLSAMLMIGCSQEGVNNTENVDTKKENTEQSKLVPTQYKVLDLTMGMDKDALTKKGFDCGSLTYSGYCEIFTIPEAQKNSYQSISNNGTINGIQTHLDKKGQIYKIVLTSRHTHNQNDIEQFKQTLSELLDKNPNIDEKLEVLDSGYFQGAHYVLLSFIDKAREAAYVSQKNNAATSAAEDIKNFGK